MDGSGWDRMGLDGTLETLLRWSSAFDKEQDAEAIE